MTHEEYYKRGLELLRQRGEFAHLKEQAERSVVSYTSALKTTEWLLTQPPPPLPPLDDTPSPA